MVLNLNGGAFNLYGDGCRQGAVCDYTFGNFCRPIGIYNAIVDYNTIIVPVCPTFACCNPENSTLNFDFTLCDFDCESDDDTEDDPTHCLVVGVVHVKKGMFAVRSRYGKVSSGRPVPVKWEVANKLLAIVA
ncbi:hypothetical protein SARC_04941 [Sphaeroforma arctica JP610]|uniref:Uncharacterized protein n=1 Tax=Sphaeroforma arctica JP610 TaxID=667725 RepID=A0A0L0G3K4_9EUKA|nr:hypothetical protein SARC_04941 [Sphaeroforma arctica JP610]KNC82783.1 hypothetical protein SARC_04941 [Sphaeroforma arctica JP610]|eukprot:XP_014156685.1 hypothetical protein SARC_04941 [Sphaeroforma arctica JP610]